MFEEIKELEPKYFILKSDDINQFLTEDELYKLHDISSKISDKRKEEGKKDNDYVVLNLDDKIDLDHWSPILKKIEEIQKSHLILLYKSKSGNTKRYKRDHNPDYVKDIAPTLINAILKAEGSDR